MNELILEGRKASSKVFLGNIVLPFRKFTQWIRVQSQSHVSRSSRSSQKETITVSQERLKLFFSFSVNRGSYPEPWLSLKSGH